MVYSKQIFFHITYLLNRWKGELETTKLHIYADIQAMYKHTNICIFRRFFIVYDMVNSTEKSAPLLIT